LFSRFLSAIKSEPVEQFFRVLRFQFQNDRAEGRLFGRGHSRNDAHKCSLPVEQYAHAVALDALQKKPTRGVPNVPVPELVMHLLQTAQVRRAKDDGAIPLVHLIFTVPKDVSYSREYFRPVLGGRDFSAQDDADWSAAKQASSTRPRPWPRQRLVPQSRCARSRLRHRRELWPHQSRSKARARPWC